MQPDMDRTGLFQEMSYISLNEPYVAEKIGVMTPFNDNNMKGRQMFGVPFYSKTALDDGYFQRPFTRIFTAEAYFDRTKPVLLARLESKKLRIGKHWMPSGATQMCGVGNDVGSFADRRERFDPSLKPIVEKSGKKLRLFLNNPGKKGTGYGYIDVCLGPYPIHMHESEAYHEQRLAKERAEFEAGLRGRRPFNSSHPSQAYFSTPEFLDFNAVRAEKPKVVLKPFKPTNPGKRPGGMHAGTFSQLERLTEPYSSSTTKYEKDFVNKEGKRFMPTKGFKSTRTKSLMQAYHHRKMNRENYKFYQMKF